MNILEDKIRTVFAGMVVRKSPKTSKFFSGLGLPCFLRDWLVMRFADEEGTIDPEAMQAYVSSHIPRKDDWERLKAGMISQGQIVRILAKIRVNFDVSTGVALFELPDFGFPSKRFEAIVDGQLLLDSTKQEHLLRNRECWGVLELAWRFERVGERKEAGCIVLTDFKPFQPYTVDPYFFCEARSQFDIEEWIDCLLFGLDYNPAGFLDIGRKLTMLFRILPFVENRLNLIELAPKGTGKSYVFSQISKYGWLVSGGSITRARLFYDIASRTPGLISRHDYVALDEVQSISFGNEEEMRGALKGYLESGEYRVGDHHGVSTSGFVLLGNIAAHNMDELAPMFRELPRVFQESALIDRFHGFIRGWDIPRLHEGLKASGWALNVEYLSEVFHGLRRDLQYRAFVDAHLHVPTNADGRDTEAIKRLTTGLVKLLFPHVLRVKEPPLREIQQYCLEPAKRMRHIIRRQLNIMDVEYRADIPSITLPH